MNPSTNVYYMEIDDPQPSTSRVSNNPTRTGAERISAFRQRNSLKSLNIGRCTPDEAKVPLFKLGELSLKCPNCDAKFWKLEKDSHCSMQNLKFSMCCNKGKFNIPNLPNPPADLQSLLQGDDRISKEFRKNIRGYNSALCFASLGANVDSTVQTHGPYSFRIHGSVYHKIGSLLGDNLAKPVFAQIYFYDTENEQSNRCSIAPNLSNDTISTLQRMIRDNNPFIVLFHQIIETYSHVPDIKMIIKDSSNRRYNAPTVSEIGVIMNGEGEGSKRDIKIALRGGEVQYINELHPDYDSLHYVLMFPFGTPGWHLALKSTMSLMDFYSSRLMMRDSEFGIHAYGRLFQQYIVDMYAKLENDRLNYLRFNQKNLRSEVYQGVQDAICNGDAVAADIGKRIVLPATFLGSPRHMNKLYQNAMAIIREKGKANAFLTYTLNPKCVEITSQLKSGQTYLDRPDLCARVFQIKLKEFRKSVLKEHVLGKVIANVDVIEFQKRGLPHCHMLIVFAEDDKPRNSEDVDKLVCAEIPNKVTHPRLYKTISESMMHGPCGDINPNCICMENRKCNNLQPCKTGRCSTNNPCLKNISRCTKDFPKKYESNTVFTEDKRPIYRRRDTGNVVMKNDFPMDNRWVVPYNPYLCLRFDSHINIEICTTVRAMKYLYKYVYKGHDRAIINLRQDPNIDYNDELNTFKEGRYVSASEASWRIFGFSLHNEYPNVVPLDVHLENNQTVTFAENQDLETILLKDSTLTAWFKLNQTDVNARQYFYHQIPKHYTWQNKCWKPRMRGQSETIGRLYSAPPRAAERYYLRILLHHVKGSTSFSDIRTINGILYNSFQEACIAKGVLEDDLEWDNTLQEAAEMRSSKQLRQLFASILAFCSPSSPSSLWEKYKEDMCDDILFNVRISNHNAEFNAEIENEALRDINRHLNECGTDLSAFIGMPIVSLGFGTSNFALIEETYFNTVELSNRVDDNVSRFNSDQLHAYNSIMESVNRNVSKSFFIDGPGGTGKTFLYNTLLATVRSRGKIALAVASSGIAALLLDGGRTAHSRFKLPMKPDECSTCSISCQSDAGYLIKEAEIIIWDEAPMSHKYLFEAFDRTARDIMKNNASPFGGKIVILGGDFRQILPVVPQGNRCDIVTASLKRSYLWQSLNVLKLKINMRVKNASIESRNSASIFADYLLRVGEGREPDTIGEDIIAIDENIVFKSTDIHVFLDTLFPDCELSTSNNFIDKSVLTAKNDDVDFINNLMISRMPGEATTYTSADTLEDAYNPIEFPIEYLNSINVSGFPPSKLTLKIGTPVILMRNIRPSKGLCNGTRLIVKGLHRNIIEAEIATGSNKGELVWLPRITLVPTDTGMPFMFKRRQFPVKPAFAMSINKSQGQTMKKVGLYLRSDVFSHGQLYVALSRVGNIRDIVVMTKDGTNHLKNIVYKEIFN